MTKPAALDDNGDALTTNSLPDPDVTFAGQLRAWLATRPQVNPRLRRYAAEWLTAKGL